MPRQILASLFSCVSLSVFEPEVYAPSCLSNLTNNIGALYYIHIHMDTSKFRVTKNTKYQLAVDIAEYYKEQRLIPLMLARMSEKSKLWIGERSLQDEFIQAKKEGWSVALFKWKLKQIKIVERLYK